MKENSISKICQVTGIITFVYAICNQYKQQLSVNAKPRIIV